MTLTAPSVPPLPVIPAPLWGDPNQMFTLSQELVAIAEQYIAALEVSEANLVAPVINPSFPVIATAPVPAVAQEPALIDVTWTVPNAPGNPNFTQVNTSGLPGPFTTPPPVLTFPVQPGAFTAQEPASPSVDLNFTYPSPSVTLPSPPTLLSLDPVNFNPYVIPTFNVSVPEIEIAVPNVIPFVEPALFTSQLLTDLEDSLDDAITLGTFTGLPPDIETNLFNRAREREYIQQADALAELDRMETMGYAFPPGIFIDARIKIQTDTAYTIAGLSREIMTKQAELILENTIKAREQATVLEAKLIDYANNVAQRAFEATKYATEASIALYNGQVEVYKASLDGYRTQAMVYDTQIKGILAQVEQLKAQIQFEQVKAEINTELVKQYETEIEAQNLVLNVAKTQLDIIVAQANVQKIKVDIFSEQIKAFVGQVNAYQAQIDAYRALVEAQGVIENVYKVQVEAYTAEVQAGVAEINANVAVLEAQIKVFEAQIDEYKAQIESMVGQATAASQFNTAEAEVYKAAVAAITSYNDTLTKQWEAVINEQLQITQIAVSAAKANGDLYIAARGLSLDASKTGAQVASQLGAAALGAIHWANNSSWATSTSNSNQSSNSSVTEATTSQSETA